MLVPHVNPGSKRVPALKRAIDAISAIGPFIGALGAGGGAVAAGSSHYGKKMRKLVKKQAYKKSNSSVKSNRLNTAVSISKRASKRSKNKKSLKQRVSAIEKHSPPNSTYRHSTLIALKVKEGSNTSQKWLVDVPSQFNHIGIENVLTAIDPTLVSTNTKTIIKVYSKLTIKNTAVSRVTIKYADYVHVSDDIEDILTEIVSYYGDRTSVALTNSVDTGTIRGATSAAIPRHFILEQGEFDRELLSMGAHPDDRKFKYPNGIKTIILNPGDSLILRATRKVKYRPELLDRENTAFQKDEFGFIFSAVGELGHGSTTNGLIGTSSFELDCLQYGCCTAVIQDGKGLDSHSYANTLTRVTSGAFVSGGFNNVIE